MSLRPCRRSGAMAIAVVWLLAALIAISHSAMQYVCAKGGGVGLPQGGGLAGSRSAHANPDRVRLRCAAVDDAEPPAPPNVGWGHDGWGGKEAVVAISILGTLGLVLGSFDPWSISKGRKVESTLPLTQMFRGLTDVADKVVPIRIQRHKEEQQGFVTALGVMVPIVAGVLSKSEAIDVGMLGATQGVDVLEIGKVYEAKDVTLNWWPILVQSANGNGSYTCKIVSASTEFDGEPVWPEVWPGNCRIVRRPESVQKDMLPNCAA